MKSTVTDSQGLKRKLELVIPVEEVRESFSRKYEQIQKKAKLPGFRRGKIPLDMLKKNYGDVAWKEALEDLFQKFYPQALKKNQIHSAGSPVLLDIKLKDDQPCTLKLELEVHPEVKEPHYLKLKIKKQNMDISDGDCEEALSRLRQFHADLKDYSDKRSIQKGDLVSTDLACFFKGQPFKDLTSADYAFNVGDDFLAPGFDSHLIGLTVHGEKEFDFTFDKTHPNPVVAGKSFSFKVKIKKIQQKILPELNDEFAKKFKMKDLSDLKQKIREDLIQEKQKMAGQLMESEITEKLIQANPLPLPESLVKERQKELTERERDRLSKQNLPSEQLEKLLKERQGDFEKVSRRELHLTYLMRKLVADLKITPSEEDIEKSIKILLPTAKPEEAKKTLKESNRWDALISYTIHQKVIDYLIKNAEIIDP